MSKTIRKPALGHDPHRLSGRKPAAHRPKGDKRAKDKLRKEMYG